MSAAEAYAAARSAIFVTPDMARYRERSRTVWAVVGSLVERFEQVGIDEGYLDLNGLVREPSDARALLGALQAAVRDATGLSCSLGCGTRQDGGQDRERPSQAGRHLRRRAGSRGGLPGAAAAARAARHRAARRAAAARPSASSRSAIWRGRTTRRSPRSAWARSAATCASAPAASIRGPSSSRPRIRSRSARRRRSTTTCSTRSRWPPSSRRSPRTSSRASSATASPRAP